MKKVKIFIGSFIWQLAEFLKIDLGIFAPRVFSWMIGCKGKRVK